MKTIITTSKAGETAIVNFLIEILPTKEESKKIEASYSLGFIRMSKLNRAKRSQMFKKLYEEGFGVGVENQDELKRRLEAITEEEFKTFKISK